jgi:hypothetical protein
MTEPTARLAMLEEIGHGIKMMSGHRTRGSKPARMWEAYPELQAICQKLLIECAKQSVLAL